MLFSLNPLADVFSSIRPEKCTKSMFLISFIFTCIFFATRKYKSAFTIHQIIFPLTFKYSPILPSICSLTLYFRFKEFTFVCAFISPNHFAMTVLLVALPLSNVNITVKIDKPTISVIHSLFPISIVPSSIWPNLNASTIFKIVKPFAFIQSIKLIVFINRAYKTINSIRWLLSPIKLWQFFYFLHYNQVVII